MGIICVEQEFLTTKGSLPHKQNRDFIIVGHLLKFCTSHHWKIASICIFFSCICWCFVLTLCLATNTCQPRLHTSSEYKYICSVDMHM